MNDVADYSQCTSTIYHDNADITVTARQPLTHTQTDQDEKLIQFHFITFKSQLLNVNVLTCFHVMSVV